MLTPNRPCEIESIVTAMRAAIGGGTVSTAHVAKSWIRLVTAGSPAISVNHSRLESQNCDGPPNPCSLIIDSAKSNPNCSAFCTISRFRSNVGRYCGDVVEINHPLLPIGMKTPSSMGLTSPLRYTAPAFSHAVLADICAKAMPSSEMADRQRIGSGLDSHMTPWCFRGRQLHEGWSGRYCRATPPI